MDYGWNDFIGNLGVVLILSSYLALQLGRLRADSLRYSMLNALGAAAVLVSLAVDFNLSAVIIEAAWLVISLIGLLRWYRARARQGRHGDR